MARKRLNFRRIWFWCWVVGCLVFGVNIAIAQKSMPTPQKDCKIKGIFGASKTRVYLLPGHPLYDKITPKASRGERWFCTEEEAKKAGFLPVVDSKPTPSQPPKPVAQKTPKPSKTPSPQPATPIEQQTPASQPAENPQEPTATPGPWMLDPSQMKIPKQKPTGTLNGKPFVADKVWIEAGTLKLRQGKGFAPDLEFQFPIPLPSGESLANKTYTISPEDTMETPPVSLKWKPEGSETLEGQEFPQGKYALKLILETVQNSQVWGRIYLCVDDEQQSYVAGFFKAIIYEKAAQESEPSEESATVPETLPAGQPSQADIAKALQQIDQNPNMTPEQKRTAKQLITVITQQPTPKTPQEAFRLIFRTWWYLFLHDTRVQIAVMISLALGIFMIILWWIIFHKAGLPGWGALIPFFNLYLMTQVAGMSPWWFMLTVGGTLFGALLGWFAPFLAIFLLPLPFIALVMLVLIQFGIARNFGKSALFGLGLLIGLFIYPLYTLLLAILAFGDAKFIGKK
jgi:hypothetical protein